MNGYELADEIFNNIGEDKNHNISITDTIRVISFFGFNEEAPKTTRIGFVCYCARQRIEKSFEKALVYGDYRMFEQLQSEIQRYRADSEAKKYAEIAKAYKKGLMAGLSSIEAESEET